MYHDQALAPAKALAFDEAVNVTLGLPFVRTSPDHGTAFDLAGQGARRIRRASSRASGSPTGCRAEMAAIDDLPPLREVIRRHDLMAKKSLGQNFLLDLNLTAKIARASGGSRRRERGRGRPRAGRPDARASGRRAPAA